MNKLEAKITTIYIKNMYEKYKKIFLYKIPDTGYGKNPFDIIGIINGKGVAIELKVIKTKVISYNRVYKKLEPHQVISLNNFKLGGGKSYLIAYHEPYKKFITYNFKLLLANNGKKRVNKKG